MANGINIDQEVAAPVYGNTNQVQNGQVQNGQVQKKKQNKRNKYEFDFDELKLYFRKPYFIPLHNNKYLEIIQPSIGDILELGDKEVYASIIPFVTNTTACRVQLWDMEPRKDWNKMSDYELFMMFVPSIRNVDFLFKIVKFIENPAYNYNLSADDNESLGNERIIKIQEDIDFSKLLPYSFTNEEDDKPVNISDIILYAPEQDFMIDEKLYEHIREYIRMMFDYYPKEEFAKGKLAKQWIIDEERTKIKHEAEKDTGCGKSPLLPLVSSLLNHPGFKYDLDGIKNLGIFAFMDSVKRLQVYEQCSAFMGGMYSGFMDTSKLSQDELNKSVNWLRNIYGSDKSK